MMKSFKHGGYVRHETLLIVEPRGKHEAKFQVIPFGKRGGYILIIDKDKLRDAVQMAKERGGYASEMIARNALDMDIRYWLRIGRTNDLLSIQLQRMDHRISERSNFRTQSLLDVRGSVLEGFTEFYDQLMEEVPEAEDEAPAAPPAPPPVPPSSIEDGRRIRELEAELVDLRGRLADAEKRAADAEKLAVFYRQYKPGAA